MNKEPFLQVSKRRNKAGWQGWSNGIGTSYLADNT